MLQLLWGILSSGSTILYGILTAAAAVGAAWFMGKRTGGQQEKARARIEQLERSNEVLQQRSATNSRVGDLSDDELDSLQQRYERDEAVASELRGVGSDSDEPQRRHDASDEASDPRT